MIFAENNWRLWSTASSVHHIDRSIYKCNGDQLTNQNTEIEMIKSMSSYDFFVYFRDEIDYFASIQWKCLLVHLFQFTQTRWICSTIWIFKVWSAQLIQHTFRQLSVGFCCQDKKGSHIKHGRNVVFLLYVNNTKEFILIKVELFHKKWVLETVVKL